MLLDFTFPDRELRLCGCTVQFLELLLCPVRIETRASTKTHEDESSKNKPSSDCQENIYWRRWLYSPPPPPPPHPQNDLRLPRACPHSPHIPQNSCWKWVCVTGPLGAPSRGWRPSRAGPFSHGQLLRSRRVSEGKTWTWNDPTKQSPRWVHPQATAPVPLTPKLSCSSLFLDLFFQLDQYIFQRSITPSSPPHPFLLPVLPSSPDSHQSPS